ncbi:MAG: LarC family nickel insertion protein [Dehalococcoidia bacterium]|nr:LarC family nickel insertion protein [Dehalococcoidia bacterium]MCB9486336.1 LarC family nickel insertion protein [Thermoflexaceae bacterium]
MSGRVAVFDCFSGIAGDMTLAALLDAGASLADIKYGLARLGIPAFELTAEEVVRGGMRALHLSVSVAREETYQPEAMRQMVRAAELPDRVTERALKAIAALEVGEWLAHGGQEVHLHEAGGVDAMIDLVGSMLALESLGVTDAACPVVTVGSGTITKSVHGTLPAAPGPAAAHILERAGFAMRFVEAGHELVTPTGAAILAAVAHPGPATIRPMIHGAGAGTMDPPGRPNALRIFIGERLVFEPAPLDMPDPMPSAPGGLRPLILLEANIDDMSAALLAHARDRLLEAGALDAWLEPIAMKKGRAATKLCALVRPEQEPPIASLIIEETTTIGVRATVYRRWEAERRVEMRETSLGPSRFKVSEWNGRLQAVPEYDDVIAIAAKLDRPAIEVQRTLEREAETLFGQG